MRQLNITTLWNPKMLVSLEEDGKQVKLGLDHTPKLNSLYGILTLPTTLFTRDIETQVKAIDIESMSLMTDLSEHLIHEYFREFATAINQTIIENRSLYANDSS